MRASFWFCLFSFLNGFAFANVVVKNGEVVNATVNATPTVTLIEEGGTVIANLGVNVAINNATILNKGSIVGTMEGISNSGSNNVIINSGSIEVSAGVSVGILSNASNCYVANNGKIIVGNNSAGIVTSVGNSRIINKGQIIGLGSMTGIATNNNNYVVTNEGSIISSGSNSQGIGSSGTNHFIENFGKISLLGLNSRGITIIGTGHTIINTGLVESDSNAIDVTASNSNIINSGTLRSVSQAALLITGTNPSLTLLRGSNLQGIINVTSLLNLNVETGLNLALTLTAGNPGFNTLGIQAPFVVVGNNIAVIDPTGLALQADVVADLSDTILGGVYRHRTGFPCCSNACECGFWAEGIGSYRKRSEQSDIVGYHNYQGGFLVGYDKPLWCGDVNAFAGATFGKAIVDQNTQSADLANYFGGLSYERIFCKRSFLGTSLIMGYSKLDYERDVMYNLAPNGIQTASSDPHGFFISPDITYAQQFPIWCYSPIVSASIRYAGLFLGNYHEHGSIANLSVEHRHIHLLTLRSEAGLPFGKSHCDFCWSVEPYIGVEGRFQVAGKHVDAELLGVSFSFDPGGPRNLAALLVGFRGKQDIGCLNLFLNVEAGFDNHRSSRILGEAGVGFAF